MKIFRKLYSLIERIKLSESDYENMKEKAKMYSDMMSTIEVTVNNEHEYIRDKNGNILHRIPKTKNSVINIDVRKMLEKGNIVFDKNVELNIK